MCDVLVNEYFDFDYVDAGRIRRAKVARETFQVKLYFSLGPHS